VAVATIDEYLAAVPEPQRVVLERLREQIRAEVPDATEVISYGMPTFKLGGRWLVALGATKTGCSFYAGAAPLDALADELGDYRLLRGTINFPADRPLPAVLVARLIRLRIAEHRGELPDAALGRDAGRRAERERPSG
jgi:uncharacterized protein YdhG (YjbR/CyaY superfamily)